MISGTVQGKSRGTIGPFYRKTRIRITNKIFVNPKPIFSSSSNKIISTLASAPAAILPSKLGSIAISYRVGNHKTDIDPATFRQETTSSACVKPLPDQPATILIYGRPPTHINIEHTTINIHTARGRFISKGYPSYPAFEPNY